MTTFLNDHVIYKLDRHVLTDFMRIIQEMHSETNVDLDILIHELGYVREGNYFIQDDDLIAEIKRFLGGNNDVSTRKKAV
jgi:NifB/MoaA-like Fe-S oxidoreductase